MSNITTRYEQIWNETPREVQVQLLQKKKLVRNLSKLKSMGEEYKQYSISIKMIRREYTHFLTGDFDYGLMEKDVRQEYDRLFSEQVDLIKQMNELSQKIRKKIHKLNIVEANELSYDSFTGFVNNLEI